MPTGQSDQALTRSPACLRPPSVLRGFGVSNGRRCAVIRVSVTYGDLVVEADFEADMYSPDIVEDLATRCCSAILATLRHLWEHKATYGGE